MVRVLFVLIPLAITIYAAIDAIQTEDSRVQHLPKMVWILLIVMTAPLVGIGAIAWLFAGRQRGPRRGRGGPRYPSGPRGPDDDPDFLRSL